MRMLELLGKILAILGFGALAGYIGFAMCGVTLIAVPWQEVVFIISAACVAVVGTLLYVCNAHTPEWDYYS